MTHTFYHWPDRTIGKIESRTIRDSHNATVHALLQLDARNLLAVEHITNALATMPDPTTPEADTLRIALGTLLEATT